LYAAAGAEYPAIMNNGTILINTGIGFGNSIEAKRQCPPLTASFDFALPLGGLPFTVGLITGFFSEKDSENTYKYWPIAGRIAYHINFNLGGLETYRSRLDTYVLLTLGGMVVSEEIGNGFWFGISAGARYFFLPYLGAYLELGLDNFQWINFGVTFKL
jgi:hypothetical protein